MIDKLTVIAFIALTAVCWGVYGPVLHKGQQGMQGSRLRPLLCVGIAYFAIAVVVPMSLAPAGPDSATLTGPARNSAVATEIASLPRIEVVGSRDTQLADRQNKPRG